MNPSAVALGHAAETFTDAFEDALYGDSKRHKKSRSRDRSRDRRRRHRDRDRDRDRDRRSRGKHRSSRHGGNDKGSKHSMKNGSIRIEPELTDDEEEFKDEDALEIDIRENMTSQNVNEDPRYRNPDGFCITRLDENDLVKPGGHKKRLIFNLILVLIYFLAGGLFYPLAEPDVFTSAVDALYFSTVTFTTIGYGYLYPKTNGGKIFTCFFALYGIAVIVSAVSAVMAYVLAKQEEMLEQMRREERQYQLAVESEFQNNIQNAASQNTKKTAVQERVKKIGIFVAKILALVIFLGSGILVMMYVEGNTFLDSLYWVVITGTTVGFGDVCPKTQTGRAFVIFYLIIVVGLFTQLITMVSTYVRSLEAKTSGESESPEELMEKMVKLMIAQGDDGQKVGPADFLGNVLIMKNVVEREVIVEILDQFNAYDKDKSGSLDFDDLRPQSTTVKLKKWGGQNIVRDTQANKIDLQSTKYESNEMLG